jgi:hypothetical protein
LTMMLLPLGALHQKDLVQSPIKDNGEPDPLHWLQRLFQPCWQVEAADETW